MAYAGNILVDKSCPSQSKGKTGGKKHKGFKHYRVEQ